MGWFVDVELGGTLHRLGVKLRATIRFLRGEGSLKRIGTRPDFGLDSRRCGTLGSTFDRSGRIHSRTRGLVAGGTGSGGHTPRRGSRHTRGLLRSDGRRRCGPLNGVSLSDVKGNGSMRSTTGGSRTPGRRATTIDRTPIGSTRHGRPGRSRESARKSRRGRRVGRRGRRGSRRPGVGSFGNRGGTTRNGGGMRTRRRGTRRGATSGDRPSDIFALGDRGGCASGRPGILNGVSLSSLGRDAHPGGGSGRRHHGRHRRGLTRRRGSHGGHIHVGGRHISVGTRTGGGDTSNGNRGGNGGNNGGGGGEGGGEGGGGGGGGGHNGGGGGHNGRHRVRISSRTITHRMGRALTHLADGDRGGGNTGCHGRGHRTIRRGLRSRTHRRRGRDGALGLARFIAIDRLTAVVSVDIARIVSALVNMNVVMSVGRHLSTRAVGVITRRFNFGARCIDTRIRRTIDRRRSSRGSLIPHTPVMAIVNRISRNGASLLSCVHGAGIVTNRTNNVARRVNTCDIALGDNHGMAFLSAPNRRTFATVHTHNTRTASVTVVVVTTSSSIVPAAGRTVTRTRTTNMPVMFTVGGVSGPNTGPSHVHRSLTGVGLLIRR